MAAMRRSRPTGFTLVELMIVMFIISLLAAILLPNFVRSKYSAHWSACMQYERNLVAALESYNAQNGTYPVDMHALVTSTPTYINSIPICPSDGISYASGYETGPMVGNVISDYTISCPGNHYQVLPFITQGFPQYSPSRGLLEYDSSH